MGEKNNAIGERIRQLREQRALSQGALGRKLRKPQQAIHKWETGEVNIKADLLPHIAEVLSVPVAFFFGETDYLPTTSRFLSIPMLTTEEAQERSFHLLREREGEICAIAPPGDPNLFAVTLGTDGMEPHLNPGDTLIVSPAAEVQSGDYVLTAIGERVCARELHIYLDRVVFRVTNGKYPDESVTPAEAREMIIGKIIQKVVLFP